MRNLLGLGTPVVCGYCGQAPLSTGTAARLCASKPARALHTGPSGALHAGGAWCPVGEPQLCLVFGIKLSLHVEKVPNRAILGEQGEFCTGSGAVRLVQGEFCPAHAVRGGVLGEFCTAHAARAGTRGEFCTGSGPPLGPVAGLFPLMGTGAGPSGPAGALHDGSGGGFALHEALCRCVAGVSHPLVVQFPPSRGLPDGRGTQNADHLAKKR